MKKLLILALFTISCSLHAQVSNPAVIKVTSAPSGACASSSPGQLVVPSGEIFTCQNGTWGEVSGGGGGGATLPFPGIVFGTSSTSGTVATSSQIQTAIGSDVYDPFGSASNLLSSTNVWTGASNTFNNGIVTNTATQGISTTNGIVTEMNGITNIYAGTSATSSSGNINSGTLQFLSSFWNGTATNLHTWLLQDILTSGPTPSANLTITPQAALGASVPSTVSFLANGQYANLTAATSGVPTNSPCLHFTGAFFTTSSVADDWCIENTPNTSTLHGGLTFTHTGPGFGAIQAPNIQVTSLGVGVVNIGTNAQGYSMQGSINSFSGNTQFTLSTNATSSSGNINSSSPSDQASYWNGTAPENDNWSWTNILGNGTAPTSTLAFVHGGSSGAALVTMPALSVGATPSPVCTVATGCGSTSVPAATSSALGGVTLASGQTSSALSTVATTGTYADLSGLPTIPVGPLKATTPSLGGTLISLGCTNQTAVTVTGATTAMGCYMSATAGNPANTVPICSVTAANTVVPEFCTAIALGVTPTAKTYNIVLF